MSQKVAQLDTKCVTLRVSDAVLEVLCHGHSQGRQQQKLHGLMSETTWKIPDETKTGLPCLAGSLPKTNGNEEHEYERQIYGTC